MYFPSSDPPVTFPDVARARCFHDDFRHSAWSRWLKLIFWQHLDKVLSQRLCIWRKLSSDGSRFECIDDTDCSRLKSRKNHSHHDFCNEFERKKVDAPDSLKIMLVILVDDGPFILVILSLNSIHDSFVKKLHIFVANFITICFRINLFIINSIAPCNNPKMDRLHSYQASLVHRSFFHFYFFTVDCATFFFCKDLILSSTSTFG